MSMRSRFRWLSFAIGMICVLLLASCSSSPSSPAVLATPGATTKPTGSLTVAVVFGTHDLDPQLTSAAGFQAVGAAIFDSLVGLTPEGQPIPGIAERWDISSDGMTHTFYIRKGVKFHDGSDLTGADVKFSIERMIAPEATHRDAPPLRSLIASVEMKDDYTVVLHLKQPQIELLPGYANLGGLAAVVPKKYIEEKGVDNFRKNIVGSGPWKVVSYESGSRLVLEAVENHWRAVPLFKSLTLLSVPEESTKVAMLKTGELDLAEISPDSAAGLKTAGLSIISHQGGNQAITWAFYDVNNPRSSPLGDVRVRKALSLAINRNELASKIFVGYASPSALWYAPPSAYFFDPNVLKPDPYDVEQAKKLLSDAGYANGFNMKLYDLDPGGLLSTLNQALGGYWRAIGANAGLVPIQFTTFRTMFSPQQKPEIWPSVASQFTGTGAQQFEKMALAYHSTKGFAKNTKNARLDELIDKVPITIDPAEKKKLALEAALLAKNEYGTLAILDTHTVLAFGSKLGGLTPTKAVANLGVAYDTMTHAK